MVLHLPEASYLKPRLAFQVVFTIFEFPTNISRSNRYSFTLDNADMFIQLIIVGNIVQTRVNGGLEGVAQHLEGFCRVKQEHMVQEIGASQKLRINDQIHLVTRLLRRERQDDASDRGENESEAFNYDIEFDTLLVNSAHLVAVLELYQESSYSSTSLIISGLF